MSLTASPVAPALSAAARKAQRVLLQVRIRVTGTTGENKAFQEETHTVAINARGALILLANPVEKGQKLELRNNRTNGKQDCFVAYVGSMQERHFQIGIEFAQPNVNFWPVRFPAMETNA
jgi:hypothetical protein